MKKEIVSIAVLLVLMLIPTVLLAAGNVAEVNGSEYATLQEAINNAGEGENVTLIDNVSFTERLLIPEGSNVILNLNGKTVDVPSIEDNYGIVVKGDLTIIGNGTVNLGMYGIGVSTTGNLTIKGGTYNCLTGDYLIGSWGTVTIEGGEFNGNYCIVNGFENGTVEVEGGNFVNAESTLALGGVEISGGTYNVDVSDYLASGFDTVVKDGKVEIVELGVPGVPDPIQTIGGKEFFFANGAAITIEARTDGQEGALIKWNGGEQAVGPKINIFGGMHNNDTAVNTSITINGGRIGYVFGGGLHKSNTTTAKIIMNGGQVNQINGGGASSWTNGCSAECSLENREWKDSDYENAPCQTKSASVTINGGTVCANSFGLIYGGGCGYSNTEEATVTINGGDLSKTYVTAGGSNGNTTDANIVITGGTIKVVQTVNRGTIENTTLQVTGGTVNNLYVGGETGDSSVTGTIGTSAKVIISEDAKVEVMDLGTNGGVPIDSTATNSVVKAENIKVVAGTVTTLNGNISEDVTLMYEVKIDGKLYLLEPGKTIKDIKEYDDIIKKDGYKFVEFKSNEGTWDIDKKVEANIELTTVFEKIEEEQQPPVEEDKETDEEDKTQTPPVDNKEENTGKDKVPKTGVESVTLTLFIVIAIISVVGLALTKNKIK